MGYNFERAASRKSKKNNNVKGIQNVETPIDVIEEITNFQFSSVLTENTKDILVLFNIEFVDYLAKFFANNNMYDKTIYVFLDSCWDFNMLLNNIKHNKFYKNQNIVILNNDFNLTNKNVVEKLKIYINMKHFDITFSNPPYTRNLDLTILKSLFDQKISEKIIFIHPAGYLLDKKFKTKLYNDIRNTNYLESVNMFWGNKLFDIKIFAPCCISVWNMNKTNDDCSVNDNAFIRWTGNKSKYTCKVNDISIHQKIYDIFSKFKFTKNLMTKLTPHGQLNDFSVNFPLIRGGQEYGLGNYSHFYSFIGLDVESYKCDHTFEFSQASRDHGCVQAHWSFNNEFERENFINYGKTKVVRFLLSFVKNGPNVGRGELAVIPWMDFTKEWNDAKLCKEFGISEELWQYIDSFIPDYYDDYKSGF